VCALAAFACLAAMACGSLPTKPCSTLPSPSPALDPIADRDGVQVTFLGVGGVIIRWQGAAVMTAPFYSNPTVGEMALSEIHSDRQLIDALMRQDVSGVAAILSGHSHYDHLMDVPYLALHKARKADIVGNNAMVKLLHPIQAALEARTPPNHLVSLEDQRSYDAPSASMRIRAVLSEHSPQIGPALVSRTARLLGWLIPLSVVTLWRGEDEYDQTTLPTRVGGWPAGTPLAFVIELLEPGTTRVVFRIYYQDSPTREGHGYPDWPTSPHAYDLAILTVGGATEFRSFPADIVKYLKAKFVMGAHWEDFFNPRMLPLTGQSNRPEKILYAPGVDEGKFLRAVGGAQAPGGRAIVPCPDKTTTFRKGASGWEITGDDGGWTKPKR
jgi:hypothetical protein